MSENITSNTFVHGGRVEYTVTGTAAQIADARRNLLLEREDDGGAQVTCRPLTDAEIHEREREMRESRVHGAARRQDRAIRNRR